MDLYDDTRDLLENLGINYDKVKIKELSDNIKTIYAMIFNMKNSDSLFFDSVHAAIFTKYTLLNSTFLFYFYGIKTAAIAATISWIELLDSKILLFLSIINLSLVVDSYR